MRVIKLCVATLLVLEVLAFVVHFNELLGYIGSAFVALVPIFIIIAVIIWLLRSIFR